MPRFVILEHDHPSLHWDLMLETGAVLWTWRLAAPPRQAGERIAAERIGDHRKAYLEYEGPVSGGRGTVRRWDAGEWETAEGSPGETAGGWAVRLCGERFRGTLTLERAARPTPGWEWVVEP